MRQLHVEPMLRELSKDEWEDWRMFMRLEAVDPATVDERVAVALMRIVAACGHGTQSVHYAADYHQPFGDAQKLGTEVPDELIQRKLDSIFSAYDDE